MKRYIRSNSQDALGNIKISSNYPDIIKRLYDINPAIFDTVSRVKTEYSGFSGGIYLVLYYGRQKGNMYYVPFNATDDELYKITKYIYDTEYSKRRARHKELAQSKSPVSDRNLDLH